MLIWVKPFTDCTGPDGEGCYYGLRCCGHGIESCVCESPKMINTMGLCKGEKTQCFKGCNEFYFYVITFGQI